MLKGKGLRLHLSMLEINHLIWSFLCLLEEELLLLLQKSGEFALGCFFDFGFWKAFGCGCKRLGKVRKG
jgi:hypothetical protein